MVYILGGVELVGLDGSNYLFSGFGETKYHTPYIVTLLSYSSSSIYFYFGGDIDPKA